MGSAKTKRVRPFFDTTEYTKVAALLLNHRQPPPLPGPDTHIHSPAFEQRFTQNTQKHSILTATKHSPTRRLTMWNNCSFSFSFFLSSFFSLVVPGVFHLTTEISRESSQKIQKMLNLRNVSHSTEDSTKFSRAKLNRNKPFAIAFFKNP